ncbi:MAG: hypothetical protein COA71_08670 [SAR86 cluster bacterium]|uniref:Uncharacterized protein n=1 Tax=SAR86 cluster bacterium TaxID=2030880 RepID=A0A2A5CCD0_9GAMM|nr:hypothetical protein [Gammaproteobacteria bacterium AH-315-E17]PCJ41110.1 MAG: hypothetical protein COA71_08670 [SAR86 cluster bacterium]
MRKILSLTTFLFLLLTTIASAQETRLAGFWVINEDLSEITDDKVELALIASGSKPTKGFFNRDREYYRGGPVEQEMYDFISYELTLNISIEPAEYTFQYGEFLRPVYLDNRGNSVSLSGLDDVKDFSFGHWENNQLIVEGRPRDNGFTDEHYSLSDDGMQLRVELFIQPRFLSIPIELLRVYDRVSENEE